MDFENVLRRIRQKVNLTEVEEPAIIGKLKIELISMGNTLYKEEMFVASNQRH